MHERSSHSLHAIHETSTRCESCFAQVPHLGEEDEPSWIFDNLQKKQLVHRLFTAMIGSVVAGTSKSGGGRKRKANNPTTKSRAKAKAKSKAKAAGEVDVNLPPERDLDQMTIDCQYGVRNKLWVDCLVSCTNHTVRCLQAQFGDVLEQSVVNQAKTSIVRLGLRFAFLGEVNVTTKKNTKKYNKWSLLRPALQAHGVHVVTQARATMNSHSSLQSTNSSHHDHH